MKIWLLVIAAASSGIVASLVSKMLGFEQSAMIGGAAGGICGALLAVKLNKK